jgi:aspartate/methionine/tyrosine aminotransferase
MRKRMTLLTLAQMIVINNPNNPTGATTPKSVLQAIVDFAKARNIIVFSDEVYRPLFHSLPAGEEAPPSILSFGYDKTISTGSMSKAFALAGIRLGWIVSKDKSIIEAIAAARDYTTISVSQLDDQVASYALSDAVLPSLMKRNMELARTNHALLDSFVQKHPSAVSWTKPTGATTAFIQFRKKGEIVDDAAFMLDVLDKTKVMFLPGRPCFGPEFRGFVRIGYVSDTEVLKEALGRLSKYVEENLV